MAPPVACILTFGHSKGKVLKAGARGSDCSAPQSCPAAQVLPPGRCPPLHRSTNSTAASQPLVKGKVEGEGKQLSFREVMWK